MMNYKHLSLLFVIILLSLKLFSQVDHWETIVQEGDECTYIIPDKNMGNSWITVGFDDNLWLPGESGIGYDDDDDNTVVPDGTQSVYMRFQFTVQEKKSIEKLILDMDYDDGFIAFLNGVEVARANVENPVNWNMELNGIHEAKMYKGGNPDRYDISESINSLLVDGENILAIEVHNESKSSSDLSSIPFLHVGINNSEKNYNSTPDWFQAPVNFDGYNLPLMIINTGGKKIERSPRVFVDMGLIYNGEGVLNNQGDDWNEYSGKVSIRRRGESSFGFEKRQYSIELQNADGSNNNVSILGLPAENDFVLYGPYSDKTMVKNVLTYELFRRTGRWAPRTKYIELILDGDYNGVYVLTEKIKRDENRVDIDKITAEDITPEEISGGYILRRDKTAKSDDEEWWTSPVKQPIHNRMWYEYFDPKYEDLTSTQANYIKDWMEEFDEMMSSDNFADPETGYKSYIKVKSFIDLMFINEITKGIDNYNFSNYFYKENDADGGQLVAGPPWDYNWGYGNVNYGFDWDAPETYGWCYTQGGRIYWYERLMEDEVYQDRVHCRWTKFRDGIYSDDNVLGIIDSCITVLGDAIDRNFYRYPILGEWVAPAKEPIPETYNEEVENLETWIIEHLHWMDDQWYGMGNCEDDATSIVELGNLKYNSVKVYPNPSSFSRVKVELGELIEPAILTVELLDIQGLLIEKSYKEVSSSGAFFLSNHADLPKGIYVMKITHNNQVVAIKKMVKSE